VCALIQEMAMASLSVISLSRWRTGVEDVPSETRIHLRAGLLSRRCRHLERDQGGRRKKTLGSLMGRGENGFYLRWRARSTIGSASLLFFTASIYFDCFRASQSASIRGTRVKKSRSTAVMASDESVGRRTLEREASWAVFQFPKGRAE